MEKVLLYVGDELAKYGFPGGHPFGPDRQAAFLAEARKRKLDKKVALRAPVAGAREDIERFHDSLYVDRVVMASNIGVGYLDHGDTPAFPGVYEAAAHVVGSALDGLDQVMAGKCRRTFQPIGGLHHARRERAAGFCVFNDCSVVIEALRALHKVKKVAYIDIDVHHGDGVFYPFEDDPNLIFVDIHEDGSYLYPGTGSADETGKGKAAGKKLNIPMRPGAGDAEFLKEWERAEEFLRAQRPQFFLMQCGADSVAGDPLAHLQYTPAAHAHAARRVCALADEFAEGRFMAFGGGGYNRQNLAQAWSGVLQELIEAS